MKAIECDYSRVKGDKDKMIKVANELLKDYDLVQFFDGDKIVFQVSNAHCAPQMKEPNLVSSPIKY